MSLINQMLRDLDARRGPANRVETAALQGMGLATRRPVDHRALLQRTGWGLGLILTLLLVHQGYRTWSARHAARDAGVLAERKTPPNPVQAPVEVIPSTTSMKSPQPVSVRKPRISGASPRPSDISHQPADTSSRRRPGSRALKMLDPGLRRDDVSGSRDDESGSRDDVKAMNHHRPETKPPGVIRKTLTPAQNAQHHFSRAQSLLSTGKFRDASKELRTALELKPKLNDARLQLATLYLRQGRTDRAQRLLEDGYRIKPGDQRIAMAYIHLLAEQGHYRQALELLASRLQQDSARTNDLALAAGLNYRMQNFNASTTLYRKALARNPDQPVWWMGLGISLEHSRHNANALEAYRRANTAALDSTLKPFVVGRITALTGHTD